jgi:hypothetical protein
MLLGYTSYAQKVSGKGTLKTTMVPFEATALHTYSLTCEAASSMKEHTSWNTGMVKFCEGYFFDTITEFIFSIKIEEHNSLFTDATKETALAAHRDYFYPMASWMEESIEIGTLNAKRVSCEDYDEGIASEYMILAVGKYVFSIEYFDMHGDLLTAIPLLDKCVAGLKYVGK